MREMCTEMEGIVRPLAMKLKDKELVDAMRAKDDAMRLKDEQMAEAMRSKDANQPSRSSSDASFPMGNSMVVLVFKVGFMEVSLWVVEGKCLLIASPIATPRPSKR